MSLTTIDFICVHLQHLVLLTCHICHIIPVQIRGESWRGSSDFSELSWLTTNHEKLLLLLPLTIPTSVSTGIWNTFNVRSMTRDFDHPLATTCNVIRTKNPIDIQHPRSNLTTLWSSFHQVNPWPDQILIRAELLWHPKEYCSMITQLSSSLLLPIAAVLSSDCRS